MKTIFETFKRSIYDPAFYKGVADETLSAGLRYYIKFSLFLALMMTLVLGIFLVPQGVVFLKERAPEVVKNYFPTGLTISIKKGEVSVNVEEPYIVPGKDATLPLLKEQGLENMLIVDTKNDFDVKKFEAYKTFALLTKTEIITQSAKGQITIKQLNEFPDSSINQDWLLSWVEKVQSNMWYIVALGTLGTFIIIFLGYVLYLLVLLLFAFVPLSVAYLRKTPISYSTAYKISLYAILPAIVLKTLLNMMGVVILPPYFMLLVFMLVIAVNMRDDKTTKQSELLNNN